MRPEDGFIDGLCRAYRAPLHRYLTQMVGSSEIAQELAQESFWQIHRTYRPGDVIFPRAMLFKVATNFALAHLRRRRIEHRFWGSPVDMERVELGLPDHGISSADRQILSDQIGHHLAAAIEELSPGLRNVFVMAHVLCKPRKEIAATLGVSEKRVDKRMTKALRACRERLAAQGIDLTDIDSPRDVIEHVGQLITGRHGRHGSLPGGVRRRLSPASLCSSGVSAQP